MRAVYRTFWNGICERRLDAPIEQHILYNLRDIIFVLDIAEIRRAS